VDCVVVVPVHQLIIQHFAIHPESRWWNNVNFFGKQCPQTPCHGARIENPSARNQRGLLVKIPISRDCHFILWQIASLCSVTTFSSSYICKLWLVLSRSKHLLLNFSERMCSDFFQNGVAKILLHASEFKVEKILFRSKSFSELSLLYGCMHKTLLHQEFLYYKRSFHQFLPAKKSFKSNKSYNVFMSYIRLKLPLC